MKQVVDVSIVSANYNNEPYLQDYFNSILSSTVTPAEIILIEDGSVDHSEKIINEFSQLEFLKVIWHAENWGLPASLNEGINLAKGEYIMRLDPDDFITEDRIEIQYNYLKTHKEIDILGSNVFYYNDESARVIFRSKLPVHNEDIINEYISGHHGLVHSSIMGRSEILKSVHFREEAYPAEEYDVFSRICLQNVIMANIVQPLTYYRIHNKNIGLEKVKSSVMRTMSIRKDLFGISSSSLITWIRIYHLFFYRKALGAGTTVLRYTFLFVSIFLSPGKILKRLF